MKLTDAQQKAISCRGNSLLVSASAGAGKTSVLTARVLKMLTEDKCDIDRLLILTYTEAAASDMRRKISDALSDAISVDTENTHLARQTGLLPCAKICTIHSACLSMIRDNFEKLELDPQFSVAEEAQLKLMRVELLDRYIESLYENNENTNVIDYFTKGRDDTALISAVDSISAFLTKEPYTHLFFERAFAEFKNIFDSVPNDYLYAFLHSELTDIAERYESSARQMKECGDIRLCDFLVMESDSIRLVLKYITARDFDNAVTAAESVKFKTLRKNNTDSEDGFEKVRFIRGTLKSRFNNLKDNFLSDHSDVILSDRKKELDILKQIFKIALDFNTLFFEKRKRMRIMSFDDIEKYALKLLIESYDGKNIIKTDFAKEMSECYDEIIVDEYQDCNRTQELIFRALSKDNTNMFMVGDVKQSIYRFRNAEPQLFLDKQKNSKRAENCSITEPSRLELSHNFRSHGCILDFVNRIFGCIMTNESGGIDYSDGHFLTNGGLYPKTDGVGVYFNLIATGETRLNKATRAKYEADYVAKKIKSIIGTEMVYDSKMECERPIRADDIAILMRHPKITGAVYEKALEREGIGCINNNPSERYLDTPEVRDVLAFLQAVDNPYNDIPLVTVMYSDYFGFNSNELGAIRAKNRHALFFDAVKDYAKTDRKTADFVNQLESLRILSQSTDVYGLISAIYEKSGILMRLCANKSGENAIANLSMLLDFAAEFESTQYKGLFSFINYIAKISENESAMPMARLKKSDSCINILSIHKSKGLEYPVVFVVNTGDTITLRDRGGILSHSSGIIGGDIRDLKNHREFGSFHRRIVRKMQVEEELYEAMRVLYVALTRPRTKLYLYSTADVKNIENAVKTAVMLSEKPSVYDITDSPSFFKWMLFGIINSTSSNKLRAFAGEKTLDGENDGLFSLDIIEAELCEIKTEQINTECKTSDITQLRELLNRVYKFQSSTEIPAKLSVSEIKGMRDGDDCIVPSAVYKKPRFIQKTVSAADKGNATHKFLQFCDFSKVTDSLSLDAEVKRLVDYEFITERESELVQKDKVLRFLTSVKMRELLCSDKCYKEERFLFTIPANEVLDTTSCEEITIQGILDCIYVVDGRAVILDYKTDRVKTEDELILRYKVQLDMYEKAVRKVMGLETANNYIYSFELEKFIEL